MAFFKACCCSDKSDNTQVQFDPNNERTGYTHSHGEVGSPALTSGGLPPPVAQFEPNAATKIVAEKDKSHKEKILEKERLQDLVKSFAKRATSGIECHFLNADNGRLCPARYFLEKDLRELRVQVAGQPDTTCVISQVTDILRFDHDDSILPANAVQMLSETMKRNLLVIQQRGSPSPLLIAEGSCEDADIFFTSMRVLRLYCQQQDYVRTAMVTPQNDPVPNGNTPSP